MKQGDKIKYTVNGGWNGGRKEQSGVFVAMVPAGKSAREVYGKKVKDGKAGDLTLNASQNISKHDRLLVKLDDGQYKCPRANIVSTA